jgi:hypothetical protein
MAAQRYGGRYSPESPAAGGNGSDARRAAEPAPTAFRNRRARQVDLRARLLFLAPAPLLFAGLGATLRGQPLEVLVELGGFAGLMLSTWLLGEGQRAEAAYTARSVAKPPALPRKLLAAALTGVSVAAVGALSLGQGLAGGAAFGAVAAAAHLLAFGLDPMKAKGIEGQDAFASERVARAVDEAERVVRETIAAASGIGDRRLEGRVERLCDQAREVFRVIERDPRDLSRARRFLSVYLVGLRDATVKFSDLYGRTRESALKEKYEALIGDLEASFAGHRQGLLEDNRSDLDVEIEVLRERLQQDGLVTR